MRDGTFYTAGPPTWSASGSAQHRPGGRLHSSHRPVKLVYWEEHPDRGSAQRREIALKRLPASGVRSRLIATQSGAVAQGEGGNG